MKHIPDALLEQVRAVSPEMPTRPHGRKRAANGQDLVSLAEPVKGRSDSLFDALESSWNGGGGTPLARAAVLAIRQLDRTDDPQADDAVCHHAANLLLSMGQNRLLCRLAVVRPMRYVLEVGDLKDKAEVLARIGVSWPREASVEMRLSAPFRALADVGLREFLLRPGALDASLQGGFIDDPAALWALAQSLKQRPLNALTLSGEAFESRILAELVGVSAHAVVLSNVGPPDGEVSDAEIDARAQALMALVRQSGAVELDISVGVGDTLALRLLSCRDAWDRLAIVAREPICQQLALGQCTVGRLEMASPDRDVAMVMSPQFLKALHASGVRVLDCRCRVDLARVVEAGEAYVELFGAVGVLAELRGFFVMPDDGDIERVIALHRYNRRISALVHAPLADNDPMARVPGYRPIDVDTVGRLNAINGFGTTAEDPGNAQALESAWSKAVPDISAFLAPDKTVQEVIRYLKAPPQWVVPAIDIVESHLGWPGCTTLDIKLQCFGACPANRDKLREAIGHRLRAQPHLIPEMCRALTRSDWDIRRAETAQAWQSLGGLHQRSWMSDANATLVELASPFVSAWEAKGLASDDRVVPLPQVPIVDLIEPAKPQGVAQFSQQLRALAADAQVVAHTASASAVRLLRGFVATGAIEHGQLTGNVATVMARVLVGWGQSKLLRHLVPACPLWCLPMLTAANAARIKALAPWPGQTSRCQLTVLTSCNAADFEVVNTLADSMSSEQFVLRFRMASKADASFWDSMVSLVHRHAGVTLGLSVGRAFAPDAEDWKAVMGFLTSIEHKPVRELFLNDLFDVPAAVVNALVGAIRSSDIQRLTLAKVDDPLARPVMACRVWRCLWITPTAAMAQCVVQAGVRTNTLRLTLDSTCTWADLEKVVQACQGLTTIEVVNEPVNILDLARLLHQHRAITTVSCALESNGPEEIVEALALLDQNKSLVHIREDKEVDFWKRPHAQLDRANWLNLSRLANGNRLLRPDLLGRGAARGAGQNSLNLQGLSNDVFEHIGSMLDLKSALALSGTSKAAYVGSRRGMETEIDQLAALLAPNVTHEQFAQAMRDRLDNGLLVGSVPGSSLGAPSLSDKVYDMVQAGVPEPMLQLAIGRRLTALIAPTVKALPVLNEQAGAEVWRLLEALAFRGVIAPTVWLEKGLGIELS